MVTWRSIGSKGLARRCHKQSENRITVGWRTILRILWQKTFGTLEPRILGSLCCTIHSKFKLKFPSKSCAVGLSYSILSSFNQPTARRLHGRIMSVPQRVKRLLRQCCLEGLLPRPWSLARFGNPGLQCPRKSTCRIPRSFRTCISRQFMPICMLAILTLRAMDAETLLNR